MNIFLQNICHLYPSRFVNIGGRYDLLDFIQFIEYLNATTSIRVFPWFKYPNIAFFCFLEILVFIKEFEKFFVCVPVLDVKSQGNVLKWIFSLLLVVLAHIVKQRFLVGQMEIVLKMVVQSVILRITESTKKLTWELRGLLDLVSIVIPLDCLDIDVLIPSGN